MSEPTIFLPQSDWECRKGVQRCIMDGMTFFWRVTPMEPEAKERELRHFLDNADAYDEILNDIEKADKGDL